MTAVLSYKRKFDGSTKGPWEGELVEENGDWAVVFYPRIPPSQRTGAGERPASGLRYHGMTRPVSILVYFDERGALMEYFCDAGLAATREGDALSFVDLDVDLVVAPDFSSFVRDYDDFATNCAAMHYTPEAVQAAFEGLELAKGMLARREMPFDGHAERLFKRLSKKHKH